MQRRTFLTQSAAVGAAWAATGPVAAQSATPNSVLQCSRAPAATIALSAMVPQGLFRTDPGLPATDIRFNWSRLREVADAAGFSRRITGLHWERSDLDSRSLGRSVGTGVADRVFRRLLW
jgi:hypothetical protein